METRPAHCTHTRDAGLYVLGELRGYELDAFARHLQTCDECFEEVELLETAGDAVPLLAARHIPIDLPEPRFERHAPILAGAAADAQAKAEQQQRAAQAGDAQQPVLRAIVGGAALAAAPLRPAPHAAGTGTRQRQRLLKQPMPKPALIGLVLVAVIGAATIAISNRSASIRYVHRGVSAGWSTGGGAALKLEGDQAEVLVDGMPLPASGTSYEIWVVKKSTKKLSPTNAWLRPDRKGEAGADVPGDYHDLAAIAVYVEPVNGPRTTRSGAIVVADLRGIH